MLRRLYIKNIALISEADIEFDGKLNVLSGETGSGKSVILESVNFVLGSKADRTMIRYGEQEATVRAEFFVDEKCEAVNQLREYDIETDGEIIISRKFTADGRSSVKINGNTVTAAMLKTITQRLVDVHGQSEHFFLLNEDNQLSVLDKICGKSIFGIKIELSKSILEVKLRKKKIEELGGDAEERERKLDLLRYQISEIEAAGLKVGEFEELKEKQNIIANTEKIFEALNAVHSVLGGDGGAIDSISSAKHYLNTVANFSIEYGEISERLENLYAEITDISETVSDLAENLTFDEEEARAVDERLTLIKSLRKKYGADEESILEYLADAKARYEVLSDGAGAIEKYKKEIAQFEDNIYDLCVSLSEARKSAAAGFCRSVSEELHTLNIQNAAFEVKFNEYNRQTADLQSADGSDKVSFMFSANKGEPLKPLNKVISGGEMSRFMLAVKTCLKDINGISTYIFDEIDAGISGYTARTVAEKFVNIAQNTQILAVSHLPQICAASTAQFLIYKEETNNKTVTKVKRLNEEEKISEIVRLTGNVSSPAAVEHAKELIKQFKH